MAGETAQGLIIARWKFCQSGGVSRHCVDLQVDHVALFGLPPGCYFLRMLDQQHIEIATIHLVDGQGCTIQRYRALGRDETGKLLWCAQCVARGFPLFLDRNDLGLTIDMTGNDMSAQFVADLERPFQVDPRSLDPAADGGLVQLFRAQP